MTASVLVQGIGFVAVAVSICIFQTNKRKNMLRLGVIAALLYTVHFFLLGAVTGSAMNFLAAARSYTYYKTSPSTHTSWILVGFLLLAVAAAILTWQGPISLLPMLGNMATGIAFWQQNTRTIRRLALIASPLWFTYNTLSGSYPGMLIEAFTFISNLIGQYRFDFRKSKRKKFAFARAS